MIQAKGFCNERARPVRLVLAVFNILFGNFNFGCLLYKDLE